MVLGMGSSAEMCADLCADSECVEGLLMRVPYVL